MLKRVSDYLLKKSEAWNHIEKQIYEVKRELENLKADKEKTTLHSPTIIEHITVEKVVVDKYEQSNNFGALGIKSLEGRLNIGANYGLSETLADEKKTEINKTMEKATETDKKQHQSQNDSPKTNIRRRT